MATSNVAYCTEQDLKDTYPHIDEFDQKTPVYGWLIQESGEGYAATPYLASNSGTVSNLYRDGNDLQSGKQTIGTVATTLANEDINSSETNIDVDSGSACITESYIKIDDEIMYISSISTNTLVCIRGRLGTSAAEHNDDSIVYQHFFPSADGQWVYDSDNDFVIISATSNPSNNLMESGVNWSTLKTRYIKNASRYFDSRVDSNLPRDQWKDKEGNFDYLIVRTSALIACSFMLRAHQPDNTQGLELMKEAEFNIERLNKGEAKLSNQVTADASEGILREVVAPQNANPLRIVETKGQYTGTYDLLKVVIPSTFGGAIGTGKYDVYCKDSDGLKTNKIITEHIITGDYQYLGFGLYIRWAGKDSSSVVTAGDEYELEVWGVNEKIDNPQTKHTVATRGGGLWARNRGII